MGINLNWVYYTFAHQNPIKLEKGNFSSELFVKRLGFPSFSNFVSAEKCLTKR